MTTTNQNRKQITDYLAQQFSLSEEQIESMIPALITTLAGHMDNLEAVLATGDLRQLGKAGHTMKGALLNLGLMDCAEIAYSIEKKGKAADPGTDYSQLVGQLRSMIDVYLD